MSKLLNEVIKDINELMNENNDRIFTIGLGSGSTISLLVNEIKNLDKTEFNHVQFVPTSLQIKIQAEQTGLVMVDEKKIPEIDLVIDGADQIDKNKNMIKGGGGALLKEKIVMHASKNRFILATEEKFVKKFSHFIPIEIHPFARLALIKKMEEFNFRPKIRLLNKGFPFISENGNIILDLEYDDNNDELKDIIKLEHKLKTIPGVIEVGLFSNLNNLKFFKGYKNGLVERI